VFEAGAGKIKQVWLLLTDKCNLRCKYCWSEGKEESSGIMTAETADKAMQFLMRYAAEDVGITFFGGEPLLNLPVLKHVFEKHPHQRYGIYTNATLLTDELVDYFYKRRDFIQITISMDGNTQTQILNRGKMPDIRLVRKVFTMFPNSRAQATSVDPKTLYDDVKSLRDLGAKEIAVSRVHFHRVGKNDFKAFDEQAKQMAFDACLCGSVKIMEKTTPCGVVEKFLAISPNGDLYPCDLFYWNKRALLGNVYTGWASNAPATLGELLTLKKNAKTHCLAEELFHDDVDIKKVCAC
jgi:uncharacterized protein